MVANICLYAILIVEKKRARTIETDENFRHRPGYAILGYGVVEKIGNKFKVCDYGAITTDAGTPMTERLEYLYDSLREIIEEHHPDVAPIEELFFNTNAKTAILVGAGQGRCDPGLCEGRTGNRRIYSAADQTGTRRIWTGR